jgi:hypothetical protein
MPDLSESECKLHPNGRSWVFDEIKQPFEDWTDWRPNRWLRVASFEGDAPLCEPYGTFANAGGFIRQASEKIVVTDEVQTCQHPKGMHPCVRVGTVFNEFV